MKLHKHWGYNKNTIDVQTQRVQISMVFSYTNTLRKKIRVILISANDALTQLFRRISCR